MGTVLKKMDIRGNMGTVLIMQKNSLFFGFERNI